MHSSDSDDTYIQIFADGVEALIDPISYMKQQLRELLDDLPEEELNLAMHNPNAQVWSICLLVIHTLATVACMRVYSMNVCIVMLQCSTCHFMMIQLILLVIAEIPRSHDQRVESAT